MTYDVMVIGGGPAGLSGAVALGRALRSVLVIDSGQGRNAPAEGIHNFLTRDGMTPAEFRAAGRAEVERYGGTVLEGEVVSAGPGFEVTLADGGVHRARRLLVTTGLTDQLPDVPGLAERWGTTVLHCPYCHGWEVRGKAIGVLGTPGDDMTEHRLRLWQQWSPDVRLLPLAEITAVEADGVRLKDGTLVEREYLVVGTRMEARAGFLDSLGLKAVEHPMGIGTHVPAIDPTGRTEVPGVWVAGNVTDPMAQVISSAAAGMTAGAMINADLLGIAPPAPSSSSR
ncbi:NAD(P)/FAD-dependent oxidoreductase [Paractinoplanes lichenicola]|uniref:NAD(P)/FAD-dependent oxidoreductase n=1 Tax=Paractinoplanes lichenicola TaxID=2802976 RepID=A0ABS1VNM2_9ACTN|nr:NAD(P)/FAD-dependent oxidoreductase [Actinoplanes lichenicola]MBL7256330.1 NAD(P)/FAD-dependent oxidoreductase [Actinoplanes lichenicola]